MTDHVLKLVEHQRDSNQEELERALHRVGQLERELDEARLQHRQHVEPLIEALKPFATAWEGTKPTPDCTERAYWRRLERALAGFHSVRTPSGERFVLTGEHLRQAADALEGAALPEVE